MSKKHSTPVKVTKPRGVSAAKKTSNVQVIDTPEFSTEFASIERDLNAHRIGTFKVFLTDMTFEWKDGQNRAVAAESQ